MKTNLSHPIRSRASVLVVTLTFLAFAAIVLASYFVLVQTQTASVARSQTWNALIPLAEAGVEDGLAMINKGAPAIALDAWAWTNSVTSDGWSTFSNGQTSITRYVSGTNNYYTATVDITSGTPVITSVGVIPYTTIPWVHASAGRPFFAVAGGGFSAAGTANIGRKIRVQTVLDPLFSVAIITQTNFDMNGNNTTVDSFDSSNPLYSTLGQYNVLQRLAGGDVATDSSIVGGLSVGNGNIYGHVYTGPGTQQSAVQIGPGGAVGNIAWNSTSSGIQPGYWSGDFNINIPDVQPPPIGTTSLPLAVSNVVTLNGGNYTIPTSDPGLSKKVVVTAPTTVWVQGSFSPQGINIATTNNASLALYVGMTNGSGHSATLGSGEAINSPGFAENLQFYGLHSLTSLNMHGNATYVGTIYAPQANATFGGGGNNSSDTSGAIVVNSLTLNGHWNFHYDENLKVNGPARGWIARAWAEVRYP